MTYVHEQRSPIQSTRSQFLLLRIESRRLETRSSFSHRLLHFRFRIPNDGGKNVNESTLEGRPIERVESGECVGWNGEGDVGGSFRLLRCRIHRDVDLLDGN